MLFKIRNQNGVVKKYAGKHQKSVGGSQFERLGNKAGTVVFHFKHIIALDY